MLLDVSPWALDALGFLHIFDDYEVLRNLHSDFVTALGQHGVLAEVTIFSNIYTHLFRLSKKKKTFSCDLL